jgi:hypothetical protein
MRQIRIAFTMKPSAKSLIPNPQSLIFNLLPALAYLAITILVTYPLITQLTTHFAGVSDNDSREFIWSTWWFKRALIEQGASPTHINILNYPEGINFPLLPLMSQSFIISLPLAVLVSPVFAFNVTYLISFPLCALAGYWLCYDLTQDRRAAFIGGLIWGFFPNKSGHALAGHLFQLVVFTLPIAILFLLRLFRAPSLRNAIFAGVSLFVASTIHPVNIAYFLLPTCAVLTIAHLYSQRANLQSLIPNPQLLITNYKFHILALIIFAALTVPLFIPTLTSTSTGQLGFLVERGVVGYSNDVLSFFIPSYDHPLIKNSSLYDLAHRLLVFPLETNAYLGYVPLILATLGAWWQRDESKKWIALFFIAAILSLGPLLHLGGDLVRLNVDKEFIPVLMPYAFLANAPFFQWSRTPARMSETTLFALMILSSYGMNGLLHRVRGRRLAWGIFILASTLIPFEYLVRVPMPTTPLQPSTALTELAKDKSFDAVLNYPVPDNTINLLTLLQQTQHQHPMIGGRVYRDQPGGGTIQNFLSRAVTPPFEKDIALSPTPEQRIIALNYFGVGRVIYQPEGDPKGIAKESLDKLLGSPLAENIYRVPTSNFALPTSHFFVFADNWYPPEPWGDSNGRWFKEVATVFVFSSEDRSGSFKFTAIPGQNLRQLLIKVNGQEVAHFGVGDWAAYQTPTIKLRKGLNEIQFIDEGGHWQFTGDPRCRGGSAVAGPFPMKVECDSGNRETRDLSLVIKDLAFTPEAASLKIAARFDQIELISVSTPKSAKPGESVVINLRWRASNPIHRDLTLFVHLLDANGSYVAGADSPPARGDYPTSRWRTNELVAYNVAITIPPNTPAGAYTLALGWYEWPSLERIVLENGSTLYKVDSLIVAP